MSLSPTNGNRANFYWCYQCHRAVYVSPSNMACPRCFGPFLQEIDTTRPRPILEFTAFDPSPEARIVEALSLMLDPPPAGSRNSRPQTRFDNPPTLEQIRAHGRRRHRHWDVEGPSRNRRRRNNLVDENTDEWGPESGILARPRTLIIIRPTGPNLPEERLIPPGVSPQNYYTGPGLQQLIEELTQDDRPGAPPAADSTIDAIPTVQINRTHLEMDSECPVCKEEFKVGMDARELPCNHVYHSECIVPWLRLHNTCPVCRHEVAAQSEVQSNEVGSANDSDDEGRRGSRCWRLLSNWWPFRSRYRPVNSQGGRSGTPHHLVPESRQCSILQITEQVRSCK